MKTYTVRRKINYLDPKNPYLIHFACFDKGFKSTDLYILRCFINGKLIINDIIILHKFINRVFEYKQRYKVDLNFDILLGIAHDMNIPTSTTSIYEIYRIVKQDLKLQNGIL